MEKENNVNVKEKNLMLELSVYFDNCLEFQHGGFGLYSEIIVLLTFQGLKGEE